jgi:hypothetical protein
MTGFLTPGLFMKKAFRPAKLALRFSDKLTRVAQCDPVFRGPFLTSPREVNLAPRGEICPLGGMFIPSITPRGEHCLLFRRMEGQTENFTPRGQFTPGGQLRPRGQSLPLGAKLRMGLRIFSSLAPKWSWLGWPGTQGPALPRKKSLFLNMPITT